MEIDGRDAVWAVPVCMHQQLVYPQAVHLNISCQNLSAWRFKLISMRSVIFVYKKKKNLLLWDHALTSCQTLTCYSVNPPQNKKIGQTWHICRFSSSAGGFIHSLHHGAVNSFSYPVKGRVNPPSIWHAAHLAERHSGWLQGGELWGSSGRGGGGLFGRCRPEQMDLSVA